MGNNTKDFFIKLLGICLAVVMILNLIFFIFGKLNAVFFWSIIIFCALMAYMGIPFLRNMN